MRHRSRPQGPSAHARIRRGPPPAAARLAWTAVLGGALVLPAPLAAQRSDSAPPRVTDSLVAAGRAIYQGRGLCLACHGPDARGGLGPDLTDASWDHGDGSFGAILRVIRDGVGVDSSRSGEVMPARGGGQISDADLRAVAAYVWSLRRPARP